MKQRVHYCTWEGNQVSDETVIDSFDQILPEVFITDEDNQMSVCANLFAVWIRSDTEARCNQRKYSGSLENIKM